MRPNDSLDVFSRIFKITGSGKWSEINKLLRKRKGQYFPHYYSDKGHSCQNVTFSMKGHRKVRLQSLMDRGIRTGGGMGLSENTFSVNTNNIIHHFIYLNILIINIDLEA